MKTMIMSMALIIGSVCSYAEKPTEKVYWFDGFSPTNKIAKVEVEGRLVTALYVPDDEYEYRVINGTKIPAKIVPAFWTNETIKSWVYGSEGIGYAKNETCIAWEEFLKDKAAIARVELRKWLGEEWTNWHCNVPHHSLVDPEESPGLYIFGPTWELISYQEREKEQRWFQRTISVSKIQQQLEYLVKMKDIQDGIKIAEQEKREQEKADRLRRYEQSRSSPDNWNAYDSN